MLLHPIIGGDAEGLIAKLDAARQRLAKASSRFTATHNDHSVGNVSFAIRKRTFAPANLNGRFGSILALEMTEFRRLADFSIWLSANQPTAPIERPFSDLIMGVRTRKLERPKRVDSSP